MFDSKNKRSNAETVLLSGSNLLDDAMSLQLSMLKIIACIAVLYIHSYTPQYEFFRRLFDAMPGVRLAAEIISIYLARIAVPTFFCVSGYVYFLKQYDIGVGSFAVRKGKSILLPFLLWNTLAIGYMFVLQQLPLVRGMFSPDKLIENFTVSQWVNAYIGISNTWYPFLYPLWFLPYLFAAFMTVHICRKYFYRYEWLIWGLTILNLTCDIYVPLVFKLSNLRCLILLLQAVSFFTLAGLLIKYKKIVEDPVFLFVCGAFFIATMLMALYCVTPQINWLLPSRYAGMIFLFGITGNIVKRSGKIQKPVLFLAEYSFLIYLTHEFALSALQSLVYPVLPLNSAVVLGVYILLPLGLSGMLILGGWLLKKLLPKLYKFLFVFR